MGSVTFLVYDRMLATSLTLPIEMLQTAQGAALGENRRAKRIDIKIAAPTLEPVTSSSGFSFVPQYTLDQIDQTDMIFLPGLWRNPRPALNDSQAIQAFLKKHHEQGAVISAVGTSCCFLAEAGLLKHKAATTHWYYFDQFQKDYPDTILKRQHFITQAGKLYCAASINALADLVVYFIKLYYGDVIANHVERHFSHEIRRDVEKTRFNEGAPLHHPDEDIVQSQIWMQDNYFRDFTLAELAERFDMSVRTFNRRFKSATGQTPLQYLQQLRVKVAKDLLKTSNLSIQEIALQVGYQDISHLADLFRKYLKTTPTEYRKTVRAKIFSAN